MRFNHYCKYHFYKSLSNQFSLKKIIFNILCSYFNNSRWNKSTYRIQNNSFTRITSGFVFLFFFLFLKIHWEFYFFLQTFIIINSRLNGHASRIIQTTFITFKSTNAFSENEKPYIIVKPIVSMFGEWSKMCGMCDQERLYFFFEP